MRFEVPKFIEIEDKIFGPLTWRQFLYVAGGGGFAVVTLLIHPIALVVLGIPVAILGAALAFYPINNRPFVEFLRAMTSYYKNDKEYTWKQRGGRVYEARDENQISTANQPQPTQPKQSPAASNKNLSSLARKLEVNALENT